MRIQISSSVEMLHEGFWHSTKEPHYPRPIARSRKWAGQDAFVAALTKVQKRAPSSDSKGLSRCRICKAGNGSRTYSLNRWVWPSGFLHYVVDHNVKPSSEFIAFILSKVK